MTDQEIFDKVATHLLTQGEKSVNEFGACRYQARDGKSCAVGCLISDAHYSISLEGKRVDSRLVMDAVVQSVDYSKHAMLNKLQEIHDDFEPEDWPSSLVNLAAKEGLSPSVVEGWAKP